MQVKSQKPKQIGIVEQEMWRFVCCCLARASSVELFNV